MHGPGAADECAVKNRSRQPPHGELRRREELQLSILVQAGDTYAGHPLHHEILDRARRAGLSDTTALRGMQGFGASGKLRAPGLARLNGHEPVLIQVTDDAARVRAFVSAIEQLPGVALIVLKPVTAVRSAAGVRDVATSAPA
jgi:uncharacterized protein